jgi:hypothetical protein
MIRRRISDPFDVVCIGDSALQPIDVGTMREYQMTRDIAVLDIEKLAEQPTIFRCEALRCEHEHVLNNLSAEAMWYLFSRYVIGVKNCDFWAEVKMESEPHGGRSRISEDSRSLFPLNVVSEVVSVVVERASGRDGVTIPFSQPDGSWFNAWINAKVLNALKRKTPPSA